MDDLDQLKHLVSLSDEELFEALGAELLGSGRGISHEDRERRRRYGEDWFGRWFDTHRAKLCGDARIVALLASPTHLTELQEAMLLVDVLGGMSGLPPIATVALIIVRHGLRKLCPG